METFFLSIALYGITHIVTGTYVFEWFRNIMNKWSPKFFGILFSCPTCFGFWVGVLSYTLGINISNLNYNPHIMLFIQGGYISAVSYIMNVVTSMCNEVTTTHEINNELTINNINRKNILND
jgi:hypothetical protein